MLSRGTITVIVAILALLIVVPFLPFLLGMSVVMLCPGTRTDLSPRCQSCSSELCPILVLVIISLILIVLPLTGLGVYLLKRRKTLGA